MNLFIFHALDQIPTDILYYIDFIVIFRTKDNLAKVEKKFSDFPQIIQAFKDVQEKTNGTEFNRFKKTYKDEKSKKYFHYKRIITK
jgi:hypothetical protein